MPHRFTVIALLLAGVLFLDPLGFFRPRRTVHRAGFDVARIEELSAELEVAGQAPDAYLLRMLDKHPVVFLGEFGRIREQVNFVHAFIPHMYEKGHVALGLSHVRAVDQEDIDQVLAAAQFDEEAARGLLFRRKVLWGYQEYLELLRSAWELNAGREEGEAPFRIIGLGARTDYSHVRSAADMEDASILRQVFPDGLPDEVIADAVLRHVADGGHGLLVYTGIESSFTRFVDWHYAAAVSLQSIGREGRAGNLVYQKLGDAVATVLLHSPWPDSGERGGLSYPLQGLLDAVYEQNPAPVAWSIERGPFSELPVTRGLYVEGGEDIRFGQMACGYIMLGPLANYRAVETIPDFITADNLSTAVAEFPGPTPPRASVSGLNNYIRSLAEDVEARLREFR
ncbi:MAG: hypothetical protein EA428_11840 [Spirochaetaceae bacterium]|nr:MAG: hypothetical protein EA428_11840 [Spirochaetaceae bacterium]